MGEGGEAGVIKSFNHLFLSPSIHTTYTCTHTSHLLYF